MPGETGKILLNAGPSQRGFHFHEKFIRCPRLFALSRAGRLGPPAEPLVRGSLGHIGLAHHFARMKDAQQGAIRPREYDPERYYTPAEAIDLLALEFGDLGAELRPLAQQTVLEYLSLYSNEGWTILHVEEEFVTELSDHFGPGRTLRSGRYTLRPDLFVADSSGRVFCIDHKFVTKIGHMEDRYTLSGQFLGLTMLGRQLYGDAFAGCIVNAIQVPPRFKVVKVPIPTAPESLRRFPTTILDTHDQIARLELEDRDPMDWPGACTEFMCKNVYGVCEAFDLCKFGA